MKVKYNIMFVYIFLLDFVYIHNISFAIKMASFVWVFANKKHLRLKDLQYK